MRLWFGCYWKSGDGQKKCFSQLRMHKWLQYILIVIWYTFLYFDVSNENACTAAKIKHIFLLDYTSDSVVQMYQYFCGNLPCARYSIFRINKSWIDIAVPYKLYIQVPLYKDTYRFHCIQESSVCTPLLQIKLFFQVNFRKISGELLYKCVSSSFLLEKVIF